MKKKQVYRSHMIVGILLTVLCINQTFAQTIYPKSQTPLSGHYPGGHVGIKGASSPMKPGLSLLNFNRISYFGNLISSSGENLGATNKVADANIIGINWITKKKILGMEYGCLLAIPLNNTYNNGTGESKGFGLGDIVCIPIALYGKNKKFDYQFALGAWSSSGKYNPTGDNNHGTGFWEILYSVGGVYYPDGNRMSFSFSAVARFEQTFKQAYTKINPGDDVVFDMGIGSPMIPLNKFGVSGFATTQFTKESGINAAINTDLYRNFGIGPEVNYYLPKQHLKFILRPQWEFGARNITQGHNIWMAIAYSFGKSPATKPAPEK
jgi:hypothetical protein